MSLALPILALLAITPITIYALRGVDRRIRRRRQLLYLKGPLRFQVAWMATEDVHALDDSPHIWLDAPFRESATRRVLPR